MAAGCSTFEIKATRDGEIPIRNVYREIISVCYGFFSPVEGSMTLNELEKVLKERRLLSEWIFPFPILFDISEDDFRMLNIREGDRLLLKLKGEPLAILDVEEIYKINPKEIAGKIFGSPDHSGGSVKRAFDAKHPGYNMYLKMQPIILAGKYTLINEPKFKPPYDRFWFPPSKCRKEIEERGWRTIMAHQTRNVPHLGHEFFMKNAAYAGDIQPASGILVNAIIGAKRIGDYPDETILESHEMLHIAGYIKPQRHLVTFTLWDMRYGGPLESVLHAIIRQNLGCTHHMFGRDHAAVGDYYDTYATQTLWSKGLPELGFPSPPNEMDYGLLIRPQNMEEFWYCPKCNEIAYSENCNHKEIAQRFSGSFIRSLIAEGISPPPQIMRPEVYKIIVKWWKTFNYPFINKRYLLEKEKELEVGMPHLEIPCR
jgi:sulfate adenylyltransferase